MALIVAAAGACQSAEERCQDAVAPAKDAWGSYRAALLEVKAKAQKEHGSALAELAQIEKRIDAEAREKADALNRKGTSAWYRTQHAARQSLCADDESCSGLKGKVSQTEMIVKEIDARVAETDALLAALGTSDALPSVEDDFDRRDLLASARQVSAGVPEACAGVGE